MTTFPPRRLAAVLAALTIAATGCASGSGDGEAADRNLVAYEVTGTEPVAWIKYIADGRTTTQVTGVPLPWRTEFALPTGQEHQEISLLVLPGGESQVTATITVNGQPFVTNTSYGSPGDSPMRLHGEL